MSETEPRTVGQALERFELVGGTAGSESDGTACAMSLLSWVDGSAWSDHPECAYPRLADVVVAANDAKATTVEQRVELVRAGVTADRFCEDHVNDHYLAVRYSQLGATLRRLLRGVG